VNVETGTAHDAAPHELAGGASATLLTCNVHCAAMVNRAGLASAGGYVPPGVSWTLGRSVQKAWIVSQPTVRRSVRHRYFQGASQQQVRGRSILFPVCMLVSGYNELLRTAWARVMCSRKTKDPVAGNTDRGQTSRRLGAQVA